ncbi:hypothetical protein MAR_034245 [Mya arenaria]|uniref:Uncharacterized protein n=1 Tax=Mya arenaria TaxID=6604 RepID=A0ABY7GEQ7_MYAAR|nr:hypothetical protein MAR_034245 [Mya arenaria]
MPRNIKQIQNLNYNQGRKHKTAGEDVYLKNLADHLINIESKVYQGHPFIRSVVHLHSGPSVILYTDEHLQDIGRFCCKENEGTILGVDKTYNLGQLHLTTTVFKNLSVVRTDTVEPPIFLGPSFWHRKSDFTTFNAFFSHIASHLSDLELKRLVVGSDDEQALRKSIQRLETVQHLVSEQAAGFLPYLNGRIVSLIKNHVHIPKRVRNIDSNWTNNNAESMNNLLKIGTNHKVEDMTDLIDIIYRIVQSMYKDVEKSIVSMGNYKLTQPYEHHKMSVDAWCQKTEQGRKGILAKFYRDKIGVQKPLLRPTVN